MNILERYHAMEYGPAPESRAEADAWIASRDFTRSLFIDGKWKTSSKGASFLTRNPATEESLANISEASEADIDAAVDPPAAQHQRSRIFRSGGEGLSRAAWQRTTAATRTYEVRHGDTES